LNLVELLPQCRDQKSNRLPKVGYFLDKMPGFRFSIDSSHKFYSHPNLKQRISKELCCRKINRQQILIGRLFLGFERRWLFRLNPGIK
jgi:hypothetical protein